MISYKEKLRGINTFIFDVDGVLTNGEVLLIEDDFIRALNSRDAYAMQYAIKYPEIPSKLILAHTIGAFNLPRMLDRFERIGGDQSRTAAEGFWQFNILDHGLVNVITLH